MGPDQQVRGPVATKATHWPQLRDRGPSVECSATGLGRATSRISRVSPHKRSGWQGSRQKGVEDARPLQRRVSCEPDFPASSKNCSSKAILLPRGSVGGGSQAADSSSARLYR
jgi:hypothetical protein